MIKARKMGEILTGLVPFFFCITMVNGGMSVVLNQGPLLQIRVSLTGGSSKTILISERSFYGNQIFS